MWKLVEAELIKTRKRPMYWVLLGILLAAILLVVGSVYAVSKFAIKASAQPVPAFIIEQLRMPKIIPFALSQCGSIASILIIILASASIGGEYNWGTLRTVLARGVARGELLAAKLVALVLTVAVWAMAAAVLAAILGSIITLIEGWGFRWDYVNLDGLWRFIEVYAKTVYAIIPYLLLAILFAVLGRSTTVGIVVGVLYTLVVDGILVSALKFLGGDWLKIANHSIGTSTKILLTFHEVPVPNQESLPPEVQQKIVQMLTSLPGKWEAAVTVLAYCVVFFVISWYVFRQRDIKFA